MRKTLIGITLTAVVLLIAGSLMAQVVAIPNETPVRLRLVENLLCENSHEGDSVAFEVADDVAIDGIVVIKHGALAYARIVDGTTWARRVGRGGRVALQIKYVTDVTGREIPVSEDRYIAARGLGTEITVAMVSSPNPLWLMALGKKTKFPNGKIFVAVTRGEKNVDLTKLALNTPTSPVPATAKGDVPRPANYPAPNRDDPKYSNYTLTNDGALIASR